MKPLPALLLSILLLACSSLQGAVPDDPALARLLAAQHGNPRLAPVLARAEAFQVQVLWTRVLGGPGRWRTEVHAWQLDPRRWFAAASLVKLPLAAFALEELAARRLPLSTRLQAGIPEGCTALPPTADTPPAAEPIERTLRRLLVVSDNEAYNRLYQWLGPARALQRMRELGWPDARLVRALMPCSEAGRDRLAEWRLQDARGRVLAEGAARGSGPRPRFPHGRALAGRAWLENGVRSEGPHDFSDSNFLPLAAVEQLLMAVVRPELLAPERRLRLREADRLALRALLASTPPESADPRYPASDFPAHHAKYLLVGDGTPWPAGVRIHNKVGQSYGYLSDVAYIEDTAAGFGFFLSAVLYVDTDGVLNDGRYAYDRLGLPFLAELGRLVLAEERRLRAAAARAPVPDTTRAGQ